MNFSRITIETAAGFVATVKRTLAAAAPDARDDVHPHAAETARNMAIRWGGVDPEELNSLARIAGHPFAPDLPGWMLGIDVQLVAPHGGEIVRVSFGSQEYERLTHDGWTQTVREDQ